MARIEVIVLNSPQQMSTSARVQKALSQAYAVLEHKPSLQPRRGYYKELAAILRGRERAVFREYLELRPQRKNLFDEKIILSEIMKDENSNQLLSIKNIESWLKDEERWSKSGSLIQVLRELVK